MQYDPSQHTEFLKRARTSDKGVVQVLDIPEEVSRYSEMKSVLQTEMLPSTLSGVILASPSSLM